MLHVAEKSSVEADESDAESKQPCEESELSQNGRLARKLLDTAKEVTSAVNVDRR